MKYIMLQTKLVYILEHLVLKVQASACVHIFLVVYQLHM